MKNQIIVYPNNQAMFGLPVLHNEIVEYLEAKGMGSWNVGIEATQILRRMQALRAQEPEAAEKMPEVSSMAVPLEHKMESDVVMPIIKDNPDL